MAKFTGGNMAAVMAQSIDSAEIVYRDAAGNRLFAYLVGKVNSGDTITIKVPEAEDFSVETQPTSQKLQRL